MLKNQVIIIIPTHNRQHYFERIFRYYHKWECKFLLVDSSTLGFIGELPGNFAYTHLPGKSFFEKIQLAVKDLQEPFVALCPDDDVFSFRGFYSCLQEVSSGNCGICNGLIGKFFPEEFGRRYYLKSDLVEPVHFLSRSKAPRLLAQYRQVLWSVYERSLLCYIAELIVEVQPNNDNFIELIIATVGQDKAGVTVLPVLFLIREISPTLSWGHRTLPLGLANSKEALIERERIVDKLIAVNSSSSVKEDFTIYFNKQPKGVLQYVRYRLYVQLSMCKILGFHGYKATKRHEKFHWNY